jgi:hypothetical protein
VLRNPCGALGMLPPLGLARREVSTSGIELLQLAHLRSRVGLGGSRPLLVVPARTFHLVEELSDHLRARTFSEDHAQRLGLLAGLQLTRLQPTCIRKVAFDDRQPSRERHSVAMALQRIECNVMSSLDTDVSLDKQ